MRRQCVWARKTQGAAGLLVAALGILLMLATPNSFDHTSGYGPATSAPQAAARFELGSGRLDVSRPSRPSEARSFHSVDQTTTPQGLSSGTLAMTLLAGLSLLLVVAALLSKGATSPADPR